MPDKSEIVPGLGSADGGGGSLHEIRVRSYFRENRLSLFMLAATLPAFISFTSYSRQIGFFYYFLYSLLMIIIVYRERERYESLPLPSMAEMMVGLVVIVASLWMNVIVSSMGVESGFGQTDYVILLAGIFLTFWGYRSIRVTYLPLLLVVVARGSIALLNLLEAQYFEAISGWFVETTVSFVHALGYSSSQIAGEGTRVISYGPNAPAAGEAVIIAWGCTGLPSLVLFSLILVALILPHPSPLPKRMISIAIGVIGSFLINLLRLTFLILVLFHYGGDAMMWLHTHIGDFMFVIWIGIYWWVVFTYFLTEEDTSRVQKLS